MKNHYDLCKKCKQYHWSDDDCGLIFYFKHEDWGTDWQKLYARNFHDAAIKFAELYQDSCDEDGLLGNSEDVLLTDGESEKRYTISAELDINYRAKEVK